MEGACGCGHKQRPGAERAKSWNHTRTLATLNWAGATKRVPLNTFNRRELLLNLPAPLPLDENFTAEA